MRRNLKFPVYSNLPETHYGQEQSSSHNDSLISKKKAGYHRHGDTLPLCVLRLEARTYVSGEDAPVSASFLVDIPTGLGTAG